MWSSSWREIGSSRDPYHQPEWIDPRTASGMCRPWIPFHLSMEGTSAAWGERTRSVITIRSFSERHTSVTPTFPKEHFQITLLGETHTSRIIFSNRPSVKYIVRLKVKEHLLERWQIEHPALHTTRPRTPSLFSVDAWKSNKYVEHPGYSSDCGTCRVDTPVPHSPLLF